MTGTIAKQSCLALLLLAASAAHGRAQEPAGAREPAAPVLKPPALVPWNADESADQAAPAPAPATDPSVEPSVNAGSKPFQPHDATSQPASPSAPAPPPDREPPTGWSAPATTEAPVLFVAEGLDGFISAQELRRRLVDALGRELISLVDTRAHRAQAVVWVAASDVYLVLRVTPPGRPEVWRQLARSSLSADPALDVVRAVLEMFWVDHFARIDAEEPKDPDCPRGMICLDPSRRAPWPPTPEIEVLDPWDTSYRRFYGLDPFSYRYPPSAALTPPHPEHVVRAQGAGEHDSRRDDYTLDMLAGTGVHRGGAFLRYEVDALKRFPRFDFGLAFIASRGQPEPIDKARRAVTAMIERRFISPSFELNLGTAFGTFFATLERGPVEVRPYLRGNVRFALPLGHTFDWLVQSDLGTTFVSVPRTGLMEYALSVGLRHRM